MERVLNNGGIFATKLSSRLVAFLLPVLVAFLPLPKLGSYIYATIGSYIYATNVRKLSTKQEVKKMKYDLAWDGESGSIEVSFPVDVIECLPKLTDDTPVVRWLREDLGIETAFDGEYCHSFGFDVGIYQEVHYKTITYKAKLPRYIMGECPSCNGKGKRHPIFGDEPCIICEGSGETATAQWNKILVLRANLKLLFEALNLREYTSGKAAESPDMRIKLSVLKPDMDSSNMHIPFSDPLLSWLESISENKRIILDEVVAAMINAFDRMSKMRDFYKHSFQAYCENGRLIMNIPGNATGIYMGGFVGTHGEMYSHNMDSGVQQLTILAGLSKLYGMHKEATTDIGLELLSEEVKK